jgi:hypothetical protein
MRTWIEIVKVNEQGVEKRQKLTLPQFTKDGFFGRVILDFKDGICVNNLVEPTVRMVIVNE